MSVIAGVGDTFVVCLESRKEISNSFKELCENVFTRCDTLCRLSDIQRENDPPKEIDRTPTARKTPMPVKMTLAGEKIYKIH